MEIAIAIVIAALFCAVIALLDRCTDLRWRLRSAESDACRWKEEAVKRGWKNPFQELAESLKESADKLEAVAAQMRQTAETQRLNAEKLKAVNANLRQANEAMKRQVEHLDKAAAHLKGAARPKSGTPLIETAEGPIETDRSKLN